MASDRVWFGGGLVFKAHRLLYHSALGSRVTKKKKKSEARRRVALCTGEGETPTGPIRGQV